MNPYHKSTDASRRAPQNLTYNSNEMIRDEFLKLNNTANADARYVFRADMYVQQRYDILKYFSTRLV